jgi:hypothetical protein
MLSLDEEIKKATADMEATEDALIAQGFSVEHWMLIKNYVTSKILHSQYHFIKDWQEKTASNLRDSSES